MATHSSVLAWRIPRTGKPGGLLSMGSHSRTRLKRLGSSSSIHLQRNTHTCILFSRSKNQRPDNEQNFMDVINL